MAATAKDIVKATGFSLSTVTKVLRGDAARYNIGRETVRKIEAAMRDLGYRPNQQARSLARRRSMMLGFICGTIRKQFFAELAEALMRECERDGYRLLLLTTGWSHEKERQALDWMLSGSVDGIFMFSELFSLPENRGLAASVGIPFVGINTPDSAMPSVELNFSGAIRGAVRMLKETGHRRIAFFGASYEYPQKTVYRECCSECGIPFRSYTYGSDDEALVEAAAQEFIRDPERADALVCEEDALELLVSIAAANNLEMPRDYSVITLDNTRISRLFRPPVTAVDISPVRIAAAASELMRAGLAGEAFSDPVVLSPELLLRQSVIPRGSLPR